MVGCGTRIDWDSMQWGYCLYPEDSTRQRWDFAWEAPRMRSWGKTEFCGEFYHPHHPHINPEYNIHQIFCRRCIARMGVTW